MLKKSIPIITIGYTILIAILSLANIGELPDIGSSFDDKIFHFLAYGLLMLLWFLFIYKSNYKKSLLVSSIIVLLYGTIIEVLQGQLSTSRIADVNDIFANSLGVVIMALIINIKREVIVKNI